MEYIIISGMSGAGKSRAASIMEDMGFFCVDNLPTPLIPKFAELCMAGSGEFRRAALVTDVRSGANFQGLFQALETLETMKCSYQMLFIEADHQTIIKRYKESRRSHPLSRECTSLEEAIQLEQEMLSPLRARAEYVINTTNLTLGKLRGELFHLFSQDCVDQAMEVRIISFGFKHGIPMEADLIFDVRFLPNPYYVSELRLLTGMDSGVRDYVFSSPQGENFYQRLQDFLFYLLPQYREEGKTSLVIAIGCTGGHHRSVAIAHRLTQAIQAIHYPASESHRDLGRS